LRFARLGGGDVVYDPVPPGDGCGEERRAPMQRFMSNSIT
jgi:hypothetical protein